MVRTSAITSSTQNKPNELYLVDEVTLGMECTIALVAVDLDELLEDSRITADTLDGKTSRVVPVTKDSAVVLIVRVLGTKECWTNRASEMLNVVLFLCKANG